MPSMPLSLVMLFSDPDASAIPSEISTEPAEAIAIFMLKVKTLPWPIPSDSTAMLPPLFSVIYCTIYRPNPIPLLFCSAVRCSFPNCLNNRGMSSAFIPQPLSYTRTINLLWSDSYRTLIQMLPWAVNFSALLIKLMSTCTNRRLSPQSMGSFGGDEIHFNLMSLVSAYGAKMLQTNSKASTGLNICSSRSKIPSVSCFKSSKSLTKL